MRSTRSPRSTASPTAFPGRGATRWPASPCRPSRMAKLFAEDLDHDGIVKTLDPVLAAYARERKNGEHFGDFTIRAGFVSASGNGQAFHADTGAKRRA